MVSTSIDSFYCDINTQRILRLSNSLEVGLAKQLPKTISKKCFLLKKRSGGLVVKCYGALENEF